MEYQSQAGQDIFVVNILNNKRNGYFIEIGSHDYKYHNNSFVLEKELGWKGIMIDIDKNCLESWKKYRQNSIHLIADATKINYLELFKDKNVPVNIDYLQIDLDVENRSTLTVLEKFNKYILPNYKFATITFEHDIYRGNYYDTRNISRNIFSSFGYILVFPDVSCEYLGKNCIFEDWWVHPDLVDINYINSIKKNYSINGKYIKYNK